jgi:Fur family ferric uptake transcriptional regulator
VSTEQELQTVARKLRGKGLRWTPQRALILRMALRSSDHFTADELLANCREEDRSVSRATVYRTLALLEQSGVVEGLETGDGSRRFEAMLGQEHHDHMVCTGCGAILEFRDDALEARQEAAARKHGFRIQHHSLRLYGLCRDCQRPRRGQGR